jgi:hypothetical protein
MPFALPATLRRPILILTGAAMAGAWSAAWAAEPLVFTVPASDGEGYGISECMQSGSECGRVMANALCEAHGHVKAAAFGSAADVTGSVPAGAPVVKASAGDLLIRCTD